MRKAAFFYGCQGDVYKRQVLAGVEDEVSSDHHTYTDPEEVIDFATRTGCDSLAISIGRCV